MPQTQTQPLPSGEVARQGVHSKRQVLEKRLRECGWSFLRHGRRHDIWTNGRLVEAIPRHVEINDRLARTIVRRAKEAAT